MERRIAHASDRDPQDALGSLEGDLQGDATAEGVAQERRAIVTELVEQRNGAGGEA
jgi:hypothetical protein